MAEGSSYQGSVIRVMKWQEGPAEWTCYGIREPDPLMNLLPVALAIIP